MIEQTYELHLHSMPSLTLWSRGEMRKSECALICAVDDDRATVFAVNSSSVPFLGVLKTFSEDEVQMLFALCFQNLRTFTINDLRTNPRSDLVTRCTNGES